MSKTYLPEIAFCGHCSHETVREAIRLRGDLWQIECLGCGSRGPRMVTKMRAIQYWNCYNVE